MSGARLIKTVISEYGIKWALNRSLYSAKLKMMRFIPLTERRFEKKTAYPGRLDIFDIDTEELRSFLCGLDEEQKQNIIETADKSCKGVIRGFSSLDLDYGYPIDWQLNPLTGKRCDGSVKWYRIPDFDEERGDIKVIWEASRFSHFITLARAYLLTGHDKYYKAFSQQLEAWLADNRYGFGANFKCGQECSLRMINTLLAYTVFRKTGVATDADRSNVKDLIDRSYRKVLSNFFYAYKCIKNNHTVSELTGMIVGAWCCMDGERLAGAFSMLDEVIGEQFTEDGGYRQYSFNYQRLALQDIECVLSLERKAGTALSETSKSRIKNAAFLMYQCQDESGDMPNYGNNDGALVFPVTSCGYRDFTPVINTVYALLSGKQLYKHGCHQEELIWFSDGRSISEYTATEEKRVASQFPEAGLFTLRDERSWSMVVLNDFRTRPAHLDQLHFDLWIDGINVLCDCGTYSYASDLGRTLMKNGSHNTAEVPSKDQMSSQGPFLIYNWTKRIIEKADGNIFRGKAVSKNGYVHTRTVEKKEYGYDISDTVDDGFTIMFHTPCEAAAVKDGIRLIYQGRTVCTISSDGEISRENAKRSLYYLREEDITCIRIKGEKNRLIKTVIRIAE